MATGYILYSNNLNRYNIGSCHDFKKRIEEQITKKYRDCYTVKADDLEVFFWKKQFILSASKKYRKS